MPNEVEFKVKLRPVGSLGEVAMNITEVTKDGEVLEGSFALVDKQSKIDFSAIYAVILRRFQNEH